MIEWGWVIAEVCAVLATLGYTVWGGRKYGRHTPLTIGQVKVFYTLTGITWTLIIIGTYRAWFVV